MNSSRIIQDNPFSKGKTRSIVYWFVLAIPLLFILYLIVGLSLNLPAIIERQKINFEDPIFTNSLINSYLYLIILLWLLFYRAKTKFNSKHLLGSIYSVKEHSSLLLMVIPLMLFAFSSAQIIYYLLFLVSPEIASSLIEQKLLLTSETTAYPLLYNIIQVIAIVILAPVIEEILFRGIFLHRWGTKWSVRTAVITSSIIFGCLHFDILWASIFGLIMCLVYLKTKSLAVPIAMHFLNNLIAVAISFWFLLQTEPESTPTLETLQSSLGQAAIGIIIASILLIIFCRKNWRFIYKPLPYFINRDSLQN